MQDRTFERTQGCWNCKHSSAATEFWSTRRLQELQRAKVIAEESPEGEDHVKVQNLRVMINKIDHLVAARMLIRCTTGRKADGSEVSDLIDNTYLCDRWSGAEGSSMARDVGKTDKLPEELVEDLDGKAPDMNELLGRKIVD